MKRPSAPRWCSPLALSLLSMTLFAAPPLAAQPFGFTSNESMLRLNLANGSVEGMLAGGAAFGLAYAPDGTLYGLFPWSQQIPCVLAVVEPTSGLFEVVGTVPGIDHCSGGLAFDAQGRLWLARLGGDVYEIDPATAQTTLVAESLLEPGESVTALTACDDRLLALASQFQGVSSGRLVILDPALGAATPLGPGSPALGSGGEGGLDFDAEGRLWAVLDRVNAIPDPFPIDGIVELDPVTGTVLSSQTVQTVGWSLAITPPPAICPFGGPPVVEVPALGRAPLALLAVLLALAGAWALRLRAHRPARFERVGEPQ